MCKVNYVKCFNFRTGGCSRKGRQLQVYTGDCFCPSDCHHYDCSALLYETERYVDGNFVL